MERTSKEDKDITAYGLWNRIGGFVMSIAIMTSSWFLNQAWDKINKVETSIVQLQIKTAQMEGNIITSSEWNTAKNVSDTERLALDRRIMRLEENSTVIKDCLLEIKNNQAKLESLISDHMKAMGK